MKNIYIIDEHQSSKQNGVGTYIHQLLKCFENSGHDVNLLSFNSDEEEFGIERQPVYLEYHIPPCGINGFLNNGKLALSLLRLYIDDSKDNIFFVNHFPCDKFLVDIKLIFPLSRIIFVIHDQGWCAPLLGNVEMFRKVLKATYYPRKNKQEWQEIRQITSCERRMYHLADDVIALAHPTRDLLMSVYQVPISKIHLIPNGNVLASKMMRAKEQNAIRARWGIGKDEFVILYAGRTVESKGIKPLLAAFEELYKEKSNVHLVVAGQVFHLNDFAKITTSSCAHVTYTGLIPYELLSEWYQIADVGILPSYTEQSSYFGIELLDQGCLIIATDGHNMPDMFDASVSLIAHIHQDATHFQDELLDALTRAISMSSMERKSLRVAARKRAKDNYSLSVMRKKYLELIN